jgi:hypothetical protein
MLPLFPCTARHCLSNIYMCVTPGQHKVDPLVFYNFLQFPSCHSVTSLSLVAGLGIVYDSMRVWINIIHRLYRKHLRMGFIYTSIHMVIIRRTRGDTWSVVRHLSFFRTSTSESVRITQCLINTSVIKMYDIASFLVLIKPCRLICNCFALLLRNWQINFTQFLLPFTS